MKKDEAARDAVAKKVTIMCPGHMTVSEMMVRLSLAGRVGRSDMKDYWQNDDDGVTGKPAGPPGCPRYEFKGLGAPPKRARGRRALPCGVFDPVRT